MKPLSIDQVNKIQEWFADNHPHIYINQLSKEQMEEFINRPYIYNLSFEMQMDCLKDYIMAQGLVDIQE